MTASPIRTEIVVVGSGAGGAVTAASLAEQGHEVVLLEEGPNVDTSGIVSNSIDAITRLYRNGGMTPILGRQSIAFVEGRCVGGSTEINSGFWHRLPADAYDRWKSEALLDDFDADTMDRHFARLEADLGIATLGTDEVPRSSALFRVGIESLGWKYLEVPRCQRGDLAVSSFAAGVKQSMQRTYIPRARAAGVRLLSDCKAMTVTCQGDRATGVRAEHSVDGGVEPLEISADAVFLCAGPIQTPALLRRSGIKRRVGDNLCIHPMIKAAALFDEEVEAHASTLPIYQVKEFWPTITIGGAVFTPGFLAMTLAESWGTYGDAIEEWPRMALYYASTRSMSRGTIRVLPRVRDGVVIRYALSEADRRNLSVGLARLCEILFAAGARAVYPSLVGYPVLRSAAQCRAFVANPIPIASMGLSTVHALSSCPMGENPELCATDSFGRVHGIRNLHVNDVSLLPDSPGVNPQGATMAVALRNVEHFLDSRHGIRSTRASFARQTTSRRGADTSRPSVLVTGAPGWLGTRLVEVLAYGLPEVPAFAASDPRRAVRCLAQPSRDPSVLTRLSDAVQVTVGDLDDPEALRAFVERAEGATLFHIAGVVHPARRTAEFERVNVEGTRRLLAAAEQAGVRRVVAVSSNSPLGCNLHLEDVFDERSPLNPYMGYGRSKARMEAVVHEAHTRGRLETVIIRPPWFYGPHQPPRQTFFFTLIKEGRFPVLGDGTQKRSMAYVDNVCQGLLLAATSARAGGETYWIADERPYAVNEIVAEVRAVLENHFGIRCKPRALRLPARVGDVARLVDGMLQATGLYQQKIHVLGEMNQTIACSIAKARDELGYAPAYALREGMRRSIEWCLANGHRI